MMGKIIAIFTAITITLFTTLTVSAHGGYGGAGVPDNSVTPIGEPWLNPDRECVQLFHTHDYGREDGESGVGRNNEYRVDDEKCQEETIDVAPEVVSENVLELVDVVVPYLSTCNVVKFNGQIWQNCVTRYYTITVERK